MTKDPAQPESGNPDRGIESPWSVYRDNILVVHTVLRHFGRSLTLEDGLEILNEFLAGGLEKSLHSFDPEVGRIEPWLYRVFSNFVKRKLDEKGAYRKRWVQLEPHLEEIGAETREEYLGESHREDLQHALRSLPGSHRQAIELFFAPGGSIRRVAREMGRGRDHARTTILRGLVAVISSLGGSELLSREETLVCQLRIVQGLSWEEMSNQIDRTVQSLKSIHKRALEKVVPLLKGRSD